MMTFATVLFVALASFAADKQITATSVAGSDSTANPNPILVVDTQGFAGERIRSLAISDDGRWLAAAGNKEVRIWNLTTRALHAVLRGNRDPEGFPIGNVHEVLFSPDGQFLLCGVADNVPNGSTRVYRFDDLTRLHLLLPGQLGCTKNLAISRDNKRYATFGCGTVVMRVRDLNASADESLFTQEVNTEKYSSEKYSLPDDGVHLNELFHFFDNDRYLGMSIGYGVKVLDAKGIPIPVADWPTGFAQFVKQEFHLAANISTTQTTYSVKRTTAVGSTFHFLGGGTARTAGSDRYWTSVWRTGRDTPIATYMGHRYFPTAMAICPNPKIDLVASADQLGEIHIWNPKTGDNVGPIIEPKTRPIWGVHLPADRSSLVFADRPYPVGEFNYNRYGKLDKRFTAYDGKLDALPNPAPDRSPALSISTKARSIAMSLPLNATGQFNVTEKGKPSDADFHFQTEIRLTSLSMFLQSSFATIMDPTILLGGETGVIAEGGFAHVLKRGDKYPSGKYKVKGSQVIERDAFDFQIRRKYVGHSGMITGLTTSNDGELIVSSSLDGTIRVYRRSRLEPAGDIGGARDGSRLVKAFGELKVGDQLLTFDGKPFYERLKGIAERKYKPGMTVPVTVVRDGQKLTFDVELIATPNIVEPLISILFLQNGEWIAWNPRGEYDSSPNAEQYLGWHLNQARDEPAQYLPVSEFRKQLYRPGLVHTTLQTGSNDPVPAVVAGADTPPTPIASAIDLRERSTLDKIRPPKVEIISPKSGSETTQAKLTVTFDVITPDGLEASKVLLKHNGRPVTAPLQTGEKTRDPSGQFRIRYTQEVVLDPLDNRLNVLAANRETSSESTGTTVTLKVPVPEAKDLKRLFVLSIGISDYENPNMKLRYAHKDATDFAKVWEGQKGVMYRSVETKLLLNEQATADGIREGMDWLSKEANDKDDVAFVFIAGHAQFDKRGVWRLLAQNFTSIDRPAASTITHGELSTWFETAIAANTILFIDTCHAAGALKRGAGVPNPWQGYGRLVLAGSRMTEEGLERKDWENGAFTEALLKALSDPNADSRTHPDGYLSFTELFDYTVNEVKKLTEGSQTPNATIPGNIGIVNLLRLPPPGTASR